MFPKLFCLLAQKKVKQNSRHNSHMDLFMLIASSITGDSEKGDALDRE